MKRTFALFERVENAIHDFRVDADPGVVHGDGQSLRLRIGGRDCDLAVVGRELDCVLEQVPNDLLEFCGVAANMVSAAA